MTAEDIFTSEYLEEVRRKSWEKYAERTGLVTADEIVLPVCQSNWYVPVARPMELFDEIDPVMFERPLVDEYVLSGRHDDGFVYRRIRRGKW